MRNRFLAINLALLLMLSSLFMQAPFAEAQEAAEITDAGTSISDSLPVSSQEEPTPVIQEETAPVGQEELITQDPAETTTAGSIETVPSVQEEETSGVQQEATPAALEEVLPAAQKTVPWADLGDPKELEPVRLTAPLPRPTELPKQKISAMGTQYLTVNGTRFSKGVSQSGTGWSYDGTTNSLTLDNYVGSSIIAEGTASGGDLNIYCYGNVSVTGTAGSDGGDAVSVGGMLRLDVISGTASFTGGRGSNGYGGYGIYASYAWINGDTDTRLNVTGGYGSAYGAPGIFGHTIWLYPNAATITGGDSASDPGCGIGITDFLYVDYCEMDVKAGNTSGFALESYDASATYSISPYVEETIIADYWYHYTATTFTTILDGNGGSVNGEQSLSFSEKFPFQIDLEDYIFTKSGCQQIGWRTVHGEFIPLTEMYLPTSDDKLTAEWVSVDDSTVLFNAFGGQIDGNYYKKTTTGSAVAIPDRTSTTYTTVDASGSDLIGYLIGWTDSSYPYYTNDDKVLCPENKWYTPGTSAAFNNKNVLYAGWMFRTGNLISYHGNGGVTAAGSETAEQVNFCETDDRSLNVLGGSTFVRRGYDFNGWKTSEGTPYSVGMNVPGELYAIKTLDLYARWMRDGLKSISASFEQGQTAVYTGSSLDSLKSMLTVTGFYVDSITEPVSAIDYTLSGALNAGISTITVTYGEKTTTFNVMVTESPRHGGGGGGGGGSTVTTGNTAATTENWGTGTLTKMTTNIAAKTDNAGIASAKVTAVQMNDAIAAVIKTAGSASDSQGGPASTAVQIKVKPDSTAAIINTTIPQDAIKSLTKNGISFLMLDSPLASLTFDAAALKTIGDNAVADITVKIATVDKNTLSEAGKAQVGDRPVYDLAVTSGTKTISDFGGGTVTVSIPYTPAANEDSNSIVIYYISNQGELVSIPNCIYDPVSGTVSFKTSHFSTYAIGYNKMNFSDVSGWFADDVNLLAARDIVSGTGEGRFSPNESVTRAQFALMLVKLSGDDLTGYTGSSFSDVASSAWYSAAVQWAYAKGVVSGWNGKFSPDAKISRQEIASMLARYTDKVAGYILPTSIEKVSFSDSSNIADYAEEAVTAMQRAGIINGYSNGSFGPNAEATRAEASKMIAALLQDMME